MRGVYARLFRVCLVLLAIGGCQSKPESNGQSQGVSPANVNEFRMLDADDEPGNWMSYGRTYTEQRFSPLSKINQHQDLRQCLICLGKPENWVLGPGLLRHRRQRIQRFALKPQAQCRVDHSRLPEFSAYILSILNLQL